MAPPLHSMENAFPPPGATGRKRRPYAPDMTAAADWVCAVDSFCPILLTCQSQRFKESHGTKIMLHRCLRSTKKQHAEGVKKLISDILAPVCLRDASHCQRGLAKMPRDYEGYYDTTKKATRKLRPLEALGGQPAAQPAAPITEAAASSTATPNLMQPPPDANATSQQYAAESVSRWMLPWEKRQMSGEKGPLRTWERLYWYVFVGAIAWFLWSRLLGGKEEDAVDPVVKAEAEKKKLRAGRMLLAGLSLGEEESEQLEGMSPQEIQTFVETHIGANSDPFEGLSPEEINDMLSSPTSAKHQLT